MRFHSPHLLSQGRRLAVWLALSLVSSTVLAAEPARLVLDVTPGPPQPVDNTRGYVPPTRFVEVGGRAVFFVDSLVQGLGFRLAPGPRITLWTSDGTPGGTRLVASFCSGPGDRCSESARFLGSTEEVAFFLLPVPDSLQRELWRTDGTAEGTFRLHPEFCVQDLSGREPLTAVLESRLLFPGSDSGGCELWSSDGTPEGTGRVRDLRAGGGSFPRAFVELRGKVYFTAQAGAAFGLWVTDGTEPGTRLVRRLPSVRLLTATRSRLFAVIPDGPGVALWASDGTAPGTQALVRFPVGAPTSFLAPDGEAVLFVADDGRKGPELWRSDGTRAGTRRLTDLAGDVSFGVPGLNGAEGFGRVGSTLLFAVHRGGQNVQIWTSGGTPSSTAPLQGCRGGCPTVVSPFQPTPDGRRVIFSGRRSGLGFELWVSGGTAAGTRLLRDLCPGPCSSSPQGFRSIGGAVYFTAQGENGRAFLWTTDGTDAGTFRLGRAGLSGSGGIALNGQALFGVETLESPSELWTSDGTSGGTERVAAFGARTASSNPRLAPLESGVVLTAGPETESALWFTDGTEAGTRRLATGASLDAAGNGFGSPVAAGGLVYSFLGPGGEPFYNGSLVRTDGTPQGTRVVSRLGYAVLPSSSHLFEFGGRLVFFYCDLGPFLYIQYPCFVKATDGTAEGTIQIFSSPPLPGNDVTKPTVAGSVFYFFYEFPPGRFSLFKSDGWTARGVAGLSLPTETAGAGGLLFLTVDGSLWRSDGTTAGTWQLFPQRPAGLIPFGDRLLFTREDGNPPEISLWITDGTQAGSVSLGALSTASSGRSTAPAFAVLGGRLFFRGWDPEHGDELWATDGTPEGTVLVKDILPGSGSGFPSSLAVAGGKLFFAATDPEHGTELWESDGTPEGTRLTDDIAPGPFSSHPEWLTLAGGNLFFTADDGVRGREVWMLPR
jgi:large repetitive protein